LKQEAQLSLREQSVSFALSSHRLAFSSLVDDDEDNDGRINFNVALSPRTTRIHNNKYNSKVV